MPKPKKGPRLGSNPSHQRLMLANLASALFQHGRVKTTEAKAKLLRPYAERLITKAKKGDVHNRRLVLSDLQDRDVVHTLFSDIAPRFGDRNGGYTRILKLGPRLGDAAPMALIELVEEGSVTRVPGSEGEGEGRRRRLPRPRRRSGTETPQDKPVLSKGEQASAAGKEDAEEAAPEDVEEDVADVEAADEASIEAKADEAEVAAEAGEDENRERGTVEKGD